MRGNPDRARALAHDLSGPRHVQAGNVAQQHGFRLVTGQPTDHPEGGLGREKLAHRLEHVVRSRALDQLGVRVHRDRRPVHLALRVPEPCVPDREHPRTPTRLVAGEPWQGLHHRQPGLRRGVLRYVSAQGCEVPQQRRLHRAEQPHEGGLVPAPRVRERGLEVLHDPPLGAPTMPAG